MMTKREMFTKLMQIEEVRTDEELVEKINAEIVALDKKADSRQKKADETSTELKAVVLGAFPVDKALTVGELYKISAIAEKFTSTQKLTHVLRKMVQDDELDNTKEGRKSLYKLK